MSKEQKTTEKIRLHSRNKNRERYDLDALIAALPELKEHIKPNKYGDKSVNFANPIAVKLLNKALLKYYYGINHWDFPDENLCPPIPGRADYLHYAADLLMESNYGPIPQNNEIFCLDIGVGATCIYPLIGVSEYDWNFIGTDTNADSIAIAKNIVEENKLQNKIELRIQNSQNSIFEGILSKDEMIDITICNPPFHSSKDEAVQNSQRKVQNLTGNKTDEVTLNFSGINDELIYEGGEQNFIKNMIKDSVKFSKNCFWFTTLVSKKSSLNSIYRELDYYETTSIKTIPMGTGNKTSRIVAWTFLSKFEQKQWREKRWRKENEEEKN
jgi:23S rRNA (adenine1618-N6)-methyltransferase